MKLEPGTLNLELKSTPLSCGHLPVGENREEQIFIKDLVFETWNLRLEAVYDPLCPADISPLGRTLKNKFLIKLESGGLRPGTRNFEL